MARVYVEAYGCAQNQGEARAIVRAAASASHAVVARPELADVGVLVTCAVIGPTESRMVRRWEELCRLVPRIIVTGCMVPLREGALHGPGRERTTLLPIGEQHRIVTVLERSTAEERSVAIPLPVLSTPPVRSLAEEIIIAQGCTSQCAYCFSRLARGRLASVPRDEVTGAASAAIGRGAVELRLTSLDTSCWGKDLRGMARLPELVRAVASLPGQFRVRVGMMSPQTLRSIRTEYWAVLAEEKVFRFLHLPVQSGADRVLRSMRRGYDANTFRSLVAEGRSAYPDLTLSTDVIVGYPGETEAEFDSTLELLRATRPEIVNVTRFSARPGTEAARARPVLERVAKDRSRRASELRVEIGRRQLERWIGEELSVVWVERGKGNSTAGRSDSYLPVVSSRTVPLGSRSTVRIQGAHGTYLIGEPVGDAS